MKLSLPAWPGRSARGSTPQLAERVSRDRRLAAMAEAVAACEKEFGVISDVERPNSCAPTARLPSCKRSREEESRQNADVAVVRDALAVLIGSHVEIVPV